MEGAPLTQEGICQVYQLIEFLSIEESMLHIYNISITLYFSHCHLNPVPIIIHGIGVRSLTSINGPIVPKDFTPLFNILATSKNKCLNVYLIQNLIDSTSAV